MIKAIDRILLNNSLFLELETNTENIYQTLFVYLQTNCLFNVFYSSQDELLRRFRGSGTHNIPVSLRAG